MPRLLSHGHKQTSIHAHFRNAVPLAIVWGSLRLAPIKDIYAKITLPKLLRVAKVM